MYRFLESVRIECGLPVNLSYHITRMMKAVPANYHMQELIQNLPDILKVSDLLKDTVVKARLLYDETGYSVEFLPYHKKQIDQLILKSGDNIRYNHKFTDRLQLEQLREGLAETAEVLIVKNGRLTDTSYCNIALFDGNEWVTPVYPLLKGTQRQLLLDNGIIKRKNVTAAEVNQYQKIRLFNALIPWAEATELSVKNIKS